MCGITGVFAFNSTLKDCEIKKAFRAASFLDHRGPDYLGQWNNEQICLVHNKLSILDYSKNSNQPISTNDVAVVFNGEIYNYFELKKNYNLPENYIDTHVIVALYEKFGIKFVELIEGDFAIALYDKKLKKLFLIRDRLGVKPLVFARTGNRLYFSSEIKALLAFPEIKASPNTQRIFTDLYLWFWANKKDSYFRDIFNIEPGEYLESDSLGKIAIVKYWELSFNKYSNVRVADIEETLEESTKKRLCGSARVATLLSGGLDSSLLTAIVASDNTPLVSYCVKYDAEENNQDYKFAKLMVKKYPNIDLRFNHVGKEFIDIDTIDMITYFLEEVMWDKVYFSMFWNYRAAQKDGFRVIINGQGSDEVWLGYHYDFPHYRFKNDQLSILNLSNYFLSENIKDREIIGKSYQKTKILEEVVRKNLEKNFPIKEVGDLQNAIAYWATKTYLLSNLMQEDRMSMASSVECRVPFTDYKLVEMAFSLRSKEKVYNGVEKFPLREIGKKYLPQQIVARRKQAFLNPSPLYNKKIISYLTQNIDLLKESEFMREIFSPKLFDTISQGKYYLPAEFYWKVVAIYRFLVRFKFAE